MTTSKASQLIVISGVFFIFAALLAGNWYDWEPARFGIRLQSGQRYQSPMFHVDLNTTYLIELDAERDIPVEKINCLLGIAASQSCTSPIIIWWLVWDLKSNLVVAHGLSQGDGVGSWGEKISREVGRFSGYRSQAYRLQLDVIAGDPDFNPVRLHASVRVHSGDSLGYALVAQLALMMGLITIIAGILLFIQR